MMDGKSKKTGFTMPELLVVVAIIGVLVAVSIPIFASRLHKARVATDWANVRSYYSELTYDFQQTGVYDTSKACGWGGPGLTSFTLSGTTVKLKTGQLWISPAYEDDVAQTGIQGYNFVYSCNEWHAEHILHLG